ncbi:cytoplasmic dynein 2 intermediate chain 1 isoform X2 [Amia ocellicauda]|uniref:cytoplasmic dynein 2 intermediate chain 1 isoform X2 n=1 Tax=Amia ocellicauda TaxID=2972642 RepID=UPI0034648DBD
MQSDKRRTKEDTWKSDDLKRHLRGGVNDDDNTRKKQVQMRDEDVVKGSREESRDRRDRERGSTRERPKEGDQERDRNQERRRERDRDRTAERQETDRDRRKERERMGDIERNSNKDRDRESRDRRHAEDRGTKGESKELERDRERKKAERERQQGKERHRKSDEGRERGSGREEREGDQTKGRERERDRDKEKEQERENGQHHEQDLERRRGKDRHRHKDVEEGHSAKPVRGTDSYTDRQREKELETRRENERRERHRDREHSKQREEREFRELRRSDNEERDRRRREKEEMVRERTSENYGESRRQEGESRDKERERRRREYRLQEDREKRKERKEHEGKSRNKHQERRWREESQPEQGQKYTSEELRQGQTQPTACHREKLLLAGADNVKPSKERREVKANKEIETEELGIEKLSAEDLVNDETVENYEEDFEDYDDDFEDVDEADDGENNDLESGEMRAEIEAIRKAISVENECIGTAHHVAEEHSQHKRDSRSSQSRGAIHKGKYIDFVTAKQREVSKKVASKQKKRSTELLRLVDLDFSVTFSLLDLPPLNEYDMYIKSFGTTNTKQAYIQCNEDNTEREIQTEDIEMCDKWTQHPGDSSKVCGGPNSEESLNDSVNKLSIDSQRLSSFLRSASQVIAVLLEEDRAEQHSLKKLRSEADSLSFGDGCLQLNTKLSFLHGREVSLTRFSQAKKQTLLSVHRPLSKPTAVWLDHKTVVCIWNIWEPSCPQQVLLCNSEIRCCCFSPGNATLVFAGTDDGSVVVWDLREHSTLHYSMKIGDNEWTLRYPTFSTDAVLATSSHFCPVRAVEPVPVIAAEGHSPGFSLLPNQEDLLGMSFQLASLDENGLLHLWVVLELPKVNLAGSQMDLGLKPGGRLKLLHSSSVTPIARSLRRDTSHIGPLQALTLKFLPSDSNHFFIGTDMGLVCHGTRHGLKIPPKFYRPQLSGHAPVTVTSLDLSPFGEPVFLVGCVDGTIRLHSVRTEYPVMEWNSSTNGEPIVSVQWAATRPMVFFVLDAASNIYAWDMLAKDSQPLIKEAIQPDRVTAIAVFGDPGKSNSFSGILLAKQSGKIEIQYFNKQWAVPCPNELESLQNVVLQSC